MFTENNTLLGNHPWYDDLVKNIKNNGRIKKIDLSDDKKNNLIFLFENKSDKEYYDKLFNVLNKDEYGVYFENASAVKFHQLILINNVFTEQQWQDIMNMVVVFDFNDAYYNFEDELNFELAGYYHYFAQLYDELKFRFLKKENLVSSDYFENNIVPEINKIKGAFSYYKECVLFVGRLAIEFSSKWQDSLDTVYYRLKNKFLGTPRFYKHVYE